MKRTKLSLALLFPVQILCIKLLRFFPELVEQVYSNGIYRWISNLLHYIFGWLPFSFGDIFYTILIFLALKWLTQNRKRLIKDTKNWCIDVFATLSLTYFAFHLFWAFNYYRLPLHEALDLNSSYSTQELLSVTKNLITKTNMSHSKLKTNDSLKIEFPFTKQELVNLVPKGYKALSKKYAHLAYEPKSIKSSLYSLPLTYMGFSGYLNPFTNEAQIDELIPKFKFPTTASHEVAHQLGYAAENEANFIGSLAAINHPNPYFNYSGYAFALRFCLGELHKREPEIYKELIPTINKGVLKNYQEVREFWSSYENPLEPLFKITYSGFLKANSQDKGIKSYSYVVALYVNYFEKFPL